MRQRSESPEENRPEAHNCGEIVSGGSGIGMRSFLLPVAAGVVMIIAISVVALVASQRVEPIVERSSDREAVTYEFVIPSGTAERISAGELIEIVPERLVVKVGDTIRVRNDDDHATNVGIFYVGANETVTMRFSSPGLIEGVCDVHPSGQFVIDVQA